MATSRTGSVLVLGCDSRSGLTVVRSLGRAGLAVDIGWPEAASLAGNSRYVRAFRDIPAYDPADRSAEPAWKRSLIDLVEEQRYDLVIPCSDPAIIPLQLHADELARHGRFYTLGDRAFTASFDKCETHRLADLSDIPTPPWVRVETIGDLASVGSGWQLPLVLKPLSSFDMAGPASGKRMVRKLYDRDRLDETVAEMLTQGPLLVQANFSGRGVGVEVVASNGDVLCAFQHERVHEPPHGGGSSYRRSVKLDPRLEDATFRLVQALDYTGVMQAEFRVDAASDRWILVEINGRFWGSLPLAVASGMDFPLGLYQVLVEGRRELPRTYRTGIHCRNLGLDIGWFFKNLRVDRSDPTLQTRKLWQVAAEIRHVVTLTERSDLLVLDDPKPGIPGDPVAGGRMRTARRRGTSPAVPPYAFRQTAGGPAAEYPGGHGAFDPFRLQRQYLPQSLRGGVRAPYSARTDRRGIGGLLPGAVAALPRRSGSRRRPARHRSLKPPVRRAGWRNDRGRRPDLRLR